MNDRLRDFLQELRENWDDHYWWARHQFLSIAVVSLISGLFGLLFAYLEERVRLTAKLSGGGA